MNKRYPALNRLHRVLSCPSLCPLLEHTVQGSTRPTPSLEPLFTEPARLVYTNVYTLHISFSAPLVLTFLPLSLPVLSPYPPPSLSIFSYFLSTPYLVYVIVLLLFRLL